MIPYILSAAVLIFVALFAWFSFYSEWRDAREYNKLKRLFESGEWPEKGTIAKGDILRPSITLNGDSVIEYQQAKKDA